MLIRTFYAAPVSLPSLHLSNLIFKNPQCIIRKYAVFLNDYTTQRSVSTSLRYLLSAVSSCSSLLTCLAIHAVVIKSRFINEGFIGDRLVSLYAKIGDESNAQKLFDEIPHRDLISWNSYISALSQKCSLTSCLEAFCKMRKEFRMEPNEVTLISIISVCTDNGALHGGRCFHGFIVKNGNLEEVKVVNALINMYGKLDVLDSAYDLFITLTMPNLVSWNSLLVIHAHKGLSVEVMNIFNSMRRAGIEPDQTTMVTVLQGCTEFGIAKQAQIVHGYIFKSGYAMDMLVLTSLMSLYAKSGSLNVAQDVFRGIQHPDRVAWTAILASYAIHGLGREAIEVFKNMVESGVCPDHVTFTHLLSACSHGGLVSEGREYFGDMSTIYGVQPRLVHYSCMVDLLGRSGLLKDAHELIQSMPMEPNAGVWGSLLGACRIHNNAELGKEAAENLFLLASSDHRNYIMLSNIYSASGQWAHASKFRALVKERNLIRNKGYSLLEHGNKVYRFVSGDHSHPDSDKIYSKLEEIIQKIHEAGIVRHTEFVLHDVEEDIKIDMINKHSEKLALAFGLLVTSSGMPLTIIKNLRICGDCHSVMKFVSSIEKRTIIIRDPKRFHHFVNGVCSCKDYW